MAIEQGAALLSGSGSLRVNATTNAAGAHFVALGKLKAEAHIYAPYGAGTAINLSSGVWSTDTDFDLGIRLRDSDLYDPTPGKYFRWQIGPPEIRFWWTVHVAHASLTWFRAGKGQAGVDSHLRIGRFIDLECLFRRWKPAHTDLVFSYDNLTRNSKMAGTP